MMLIVIMTMMMKRKNFGMVLHLGGFKDKMLASLILIILGENVIQNSSIGTSLVAQWLRVRLPMQGTRVPSLVREDPTCRGATKPVRHNY